MLRMNGLEPPDMSLLANMIPEGAGHLTLLCISWCRS